MDKKKLMKLLYKSLPSRTNEIIEIVSPLKELKIFGIHNMKIFTEAGTLPRQIELAFQQPIRVLRETGGSIEAVKSWLRYMSVPRDDAGLERVVFSHPPEARFPIGTTLIEILDKAETILPSILAELQIDPDTETDLWFRAGLEFRRKVLGYCLWAAVAATTV